MLMPTFRSRFVFQALGILTFLLGLTRVANAQDSHPRFELFSEGGISTTNQFTTSQSGVVSLQPLQFGEVTIKSSLRTTGRLFTGVRLWLDKNQALEASYSYSPSSLLSNATCLPACTGATRTVLLRANFFAGNYVHTLPQVGTFRPFLTAGAGGLALGQEYYGSVRHDPFAVNLGGGFDHNLSKHWSLRAESRDWLFDMPHFGNSGSGLVHNVVPSLGPVFRF